MLPILIAIDKNKLKLALFIFIILILPIFLKIFIEDFNFFALLQLIFWVVSILFLRLFDLFRRES